MARLLQQRGAPSLLGSEIPAHSSRFTSIDPLAFRTVPLLCTALAFAAGILCAHAWRPAALLVLATALLLALAALAIGKAPRLGLPAVLVAWLVLGWTCAALRPPRVADAPLLRYADGLQREVRGTVVALRPLTDLPAETTEQERSAAGNRSDDSSEILDEDPDGSPHQRYALTLAVDAIEAVTPDVSTMVPISGGVDLTVARPSQSLACGTVVDVPARLRPPVEYRDPGTWRYQDYLATKGVSSTGIARGDRLHIVGGRGSSFHCHLQAWQSRGANQLQRLARMPQRGPAWLRFRAADAAVLSAMLLGDRSALTHSLRSQFERTGTFHLFVVAGLHVTLVAGALLWLALRVRLPRSLATVLAIAGTAGYALLTGFGAPVQRALVMTVVYLLARLLMRQRSVLNAVGAAGLAMLALSPSSLFEAGFQMTMLVALAIGGIAVPLLERTIGPYTRSLHNLPMLRFDRHLRPHVAQFRVIVRWSGQALAHGSGIAWLRFVPWTIVRCWMAVASLTILAVTTELVMALPMAIYFHRVTPFALPANLLVLPLLPVLMACGLVTFLLALVSVHTALPMAAITAVVLHATNAVVGFFGNPLLSDVRTPGPTIPLALLALACVAASILLVRSTSRMRAWCGVVALAFVFSLAIAPLRPSHRDGKLTVTAIDVGQGDSILVRGPSGAPLLVDAGGIPGPAQEAAFDIGEEVVSPFLWSQGVRRLDVVVLTHGDMDHMGGMAAVVRNFRPRELWISVDPDSAGFRALLAEAREQNVTVRHMAAGMVVSWAGAQVQAMSPTPQYVAERGPGPSANGDSLVLRFIAGKASAQLEGDAERPSEQEMVRAGLPAATLLKIGHHGSNTSSADAFLETLHPRYAVISCGRANHFGHPRAQVLERLQNNRVLTARTDTMGAMQYQLAQDGSVVVRALAQP